MPRNLAVFFFLLIFAGAVLAETPATPKNPDKGDILLAGVVLTPGEGGEKVGLPAGLIPLQGAIVTIEGTKLVTTTDGRGLFIFVEAPEGEVTVVITCQGYQTVKRRATVQKGVEEPPTLRVEMLKVGATQTGDILSGSGTLYACFVPRTAAANGDDGDFTSLLAILALNVDPLSIGETRQPTNPNVLDPVNQDSAPTTDANHSIMIRPAEAPSRTTYHEIGPLPVWPCFDQTGRYLYVATIYPHRIEIIDVTKGNDSVAWVPLQGNPAFVTSLTLSKDGRYVFATQFGTKTGVLAVDTSTNLPAAFFDLDDPGLIPNALALSPDGRLLYLAASSAYNAGGPGQLITLDSSTGQRVASVTVGGTPTDVLVTPDGKTALTVNQGNGNLSVVDLTKGEVVSTLQAEVSPTKAVLTRDGSKVLVVNKGNGTVSVLELASGRILGRIKVGRGPMDIVLGADGSEAYVSNYQDGTISVLDVAKGVVKASTPPMPRSNPIGLAVRP